MNKYIPTLMKARLFAGFSQKELAGLLPALQPVVRGYGKGQAAFVAGHSYGEVALVLQGQLCAHKTSGSGKEFIVSQFFMADMFGDVLAAGAIKSPVTIFAQVPSLLMFFPTNLLFAFISGGSSASARLLKNFVATLSHKYFLQAKRIDFLLITRLRPRLCAYLLAHMQGAAAGSFCIPHTRQAMAAYLGCERSALSREISALVRLGYIKTKKENFTVLDAGALNALVKNCV